jgi:hypothetical protein
MVLSAKHPSSSFLFSPRNSSVQYWEINASPFSPHYRAIPIDTNLNVALISPFSLRSKREVPLPVTWALVLLASPAQSHIPVQSYILANDIRGSVVRWGTATNRKVAGSILDEVIGFFNWPNPSSSTMAQGSIQPLTEMSPRNLLVGSKARPVRKTDNLTAICEPII